MHSFDCTHALANAHARTSVTMPEPSTRQWLEQAIARSGLKPTPFAQKAGIAPSTILRALAAAGDFDLDPRTVRKLRDTYGLPPPGGAATGFSEPDLAPYEAEDGEADMPAAPNVYLKRVGSRVMELDGILPGDVLTLDMARVPAQGDTVEAQVYALDRPVAETVLRLYDPPYLLARTLDPAHAKPLLVDGERVRIAAVLVRLARIFHKRTP